MWTFSLLHAFATLWSCDFRNFGNLLKYRGAAEYACFILQFNLKDGIVKSDANLCDRTRLSDLHLNSFPIMEGKDLFCQVLISLKQR